MNSQSAPSFPAAPEGAPILSDSYAHAAIRRIAARSGLLVVAALVIVVYGPTFAKLVEYWAANDMYSYAFVVPAVSGILIWIRWAALRAVSLSSSLLLGGAVTSAGLALLTIGRISNTNIVEELSIVVTLCGLTLLLFGRRTFRVLRFPLFYLFAMVPVWDAMTTRMHPYFQVYSANVGVGALRLIGIPALREGVLIELPNVTLEVAQACSGVNYLIAIFCIGVPLTAIFVRRWPTRLFIILVAALIALLSNGLRVAVVSLFAYYGVRGADGDIHGPFALFRSLLISGIGFVALFGLILWLADADQPLASRGPDRRVGSAFASAPASVALAISLLLAFMGFERTHVVAAVPLTKDLRKFPQHIAGRHAAGAQSSLSSDFRSIRFDQTLSRAYTASDGSHMDLFLGYFNAQEQGRELAGYDIRASLGPHEPLSYRIASTAAPVNDFLTTRGSDTFHVTYWYVLNGIVLTDDYETKLYTAWNAIVHGRGNGGIVVVKTRATEGASIESARERDRAFVERVLPLSTEYLH